MKSNISYKAIKKNTNLLQFDTFKKIVVANSVKNVPERLKNHKNDTNTPLDFFC